MDDSQIRMEFEIRKLQLEEMFKKYSINEDPNFETYDQLEAQKKSLIVLADSYGQQQNVLLNELNFFQRFKSTLDYMWRSFENRVNAYRSNRTKTLEDAINLQSSWLFNMLVKENEKLRNISSANAMPFN